VRLRLPFKSFNLVNPLYDETKKRKHSSSSTLHTQDSSRESDVDEEDDEEQDARKKRSIQLDTFKKWQKDFDKNTNPLVGWTA